MGSCCLNCNLSIFSLVSHLGDTCPLSVLLLKADHLSQMQGDHCQAEQLAFFLTPAARLLNSMSTSTLTFQAGAQELFQPWYSGAQPRQPPSRVPSPHVTSQGL